MDNQSITIDNREIKLIELFRQTKIPINISNLAIGDIILKHTIDFIQDLALAPSENKAETSEPVNQLHETPNTRQITYELIIERKCVQDMVASIKDGRYKEQKIRLLAEASTAHTTHTASNDRYVIIVYIIEGTPAELRAPADKTILLGTVISSAFRDKIPILRTYSLQETFDMIVRLNDRLGKNFADFFPISKISTEQQSTHASETTSNQSNQSLQISQNGAASYLSAIKKNKKDNMTPAMWNMNCLCGIPGVSSAIAIKIAERYPTLRALLDAYIAIASNDISKKETLLADIILTETDKQRRRIGNVISKRVYEYFQF
jgi:crossover junction endonuclease MUS81